MAQPRKKKPGPKRRTGRPATAAARAKNTAYQKAQREALQEVGYVVMQVVVSAQESASLRRRSQVNRLEGLIAVAEAQGDKEDAMRQQHRLAALRIQHAAEVRAENEAKAAQEREEWRRIEAYRQQQAAEVEARLREAKQPWTI